tara:strand:- start:25865 stop:26587 length:723 start_codon:yes stop_codon:yes gene_type:complete
MEPFLPNGMDLFCDCVRKIMLYEMRLVGLAMDPFSNSPIVILRDKLSADEEDEREAEGDSSTGSFSLELDDFSDELEIELELESDDPEHPPIQEQILPIWIGESEANAIATELLGIAPPRPMTHDLVKQMLTALGGTVASVIITDVRENTFYATIELSTEQDGIISLDARPSDALAIALRCKAPIFVDESVLEKTRQNEIEGRKEGESQSPERDFYEEVKDEWKDVVEGLARGTLEKYKQ